MSAGVPEVQQEFSDRRVAEIPFQVWENAAGLIEKIARPPMTLQTKNMAGDRLLERKGRGGAIHPGIILQIQTGQISIRRSGRGWPQIFTPSASTTCQKKHCHDQKGIDSFHLIPQAILSCSEQKGGQAKLMTVRPVYYPKILWLRFAPITRSVS
jgi:hypothetical protein